MNRTELDKHVSERLGIAGTLPDVLEHRPRTVDRIIDDIDRYPELPEPEPEELERVRWDRENAGERFDFQS